MPNRPLITIVTPSYNQGRFIAETIESVLSQAGDFRIEYIIMDGGSTDNSVEVIKKYDRLLKDGKWPVRCLGIRYSWTSGKDNGQADAVNKGFRSASGGILGWLNSDDTYIPGAFKKVADYLKAHEDVGMVYGEGYHIKDTGEVIERYPTEPFDRERFAETCFICQPTVFLRREVLDKAGYLDEKLHYCMDYEYWMRVVKACGVGYLPDYLANTRFYAGTKTMSGRLEVCTEAIEVLRKHYGYVPGTWLFALAHYRVEKIFGKRRKGLVFNLSWAVFFIIKFVRVNGRFPFAELKGLGARGGERAGDN